MSLERVSTTSLMRRAATTVLALSLAFAGLLASPANTHVAASQSAAPTMTVYLPNITRMLGGPTGWQTPFIVQNVGTAATDLDIEFYSFADGSLVTKRHVTGLKPGTSFADVPNNDTDLPAGGQFSVVVRSSSAQIVSVVNEHQGSGARAEALSYVGLSSGSTKVSLPLVCNCNNGWFSTFIIQNLGAAPTIATISLAGGSDNIVTLTRQILPGRSQFVDPRVEPTIPTGAHFSGTITADQPIAAVVNVHNDDPTIGAPRAFSYNGIGATGGEVYLPYVARNADSGRTSLMYVQNAGTAPATPTIELRRNGTLVTRTARQPLPPGDADRFDPLSDSGLADGEYSAVVSGGQFAVLNETLGPGTALGYTGTAQPSPRLYLPNVTRTLGGLTGWTTPILLQSAGATSAAVRWYRFSDGALEKIELHTGLARGQSVRIDPRSVSSLKDNAQYSVVIDGADGNIAAVVLEYADGGDNAMAYEAFGGAQTSLPTEATPTATAQPTATPPPGATPPTSVFAQPPDVYFKTIPGYSYRAIPESDMTDLRTTLSRTFGTIFLDSAGRGVSRNGKMVGMVFVFKLVPDFAGNQAFKSNTLDNYIQRFAPQATRVSVLNQPGVFLDEPPDSLDMLIYFQGAYFVIVVGDDKTQMLQLGTALVSANN